MSLRLLLLIFCIAGHRPDCRGIAEARSSSSSRIRVLPQEGPNANAPQFDAAVYRFQVQENNLPEITVGHVTATDPDEYANGRLTYALQDALSDRKDNAGDSRLFRITQHGTILTAAMLDRESVSLLRFTATARDHGNPSFTASTLVEVAVTDANEFAPIFGHEQYHFELAVNGSHPGSLVGELIAIDIDTTSERLQFFVLRHQQSASRLPFCLSPSGRSGGSAGGFVVQLRTTEGFTHDRKYRFRVVAIDSGSPPLSSTCEVLVVVR